MARTQFAAAANAAVLCWALQGIAEAAPVGEASSVVPAASYTRGDAVKELAIKDPLEQNDVIRTSGAGATQVRFLDDTILTIGPNSEVRLDRFVYEGRTARTATIEVVKGAMRFVSGTSDRRAYEIRTATATIGVRGTVLEIGTNIVNMVDGIATVCHRVLNSCRELLAGGIGLVLLETGFRDATASEMSQLGRMLDGAHALLAKVAGRDPSAPLGAAAGDGKPEGDDGKSSVGDGPSKLRERLQDLIPQFGPGPAFPITFTPLNINGVGGEIPTSTFAEGHHGLLLLPETTLWDPGVDGALAAAVFFRELGDTNPTLLYRTTAKAVNVTTGYDIFQGSLLAEPIYQIGMWTNGKVKYDQLNGPSGILQGGPTQAIHYMVWGYNGLLFSPSGVGNLSGINIGTASHISGINVLFNLESATRPSWTHTASPYTNNTLAGTIAVGIGAAWLSWGLDLSITMAEGVYRVATEGGIGNPNASQIQTPINTLAWSTDLLSATGPTCDNNCTASITAHMLSPNTFNPAEGSGRIGIVYEVSVPGMGPNGDDISGVGVFKHAPGSSGPGAEPAFPSFVSMFNVAVVSPPIATDWGDQSVSLHGKRQDFSWDASGHVRSFKVAPGSAELTNPITASRNVVGGAQALEVRTGTATTTDLGTFPIYQIGRWADGKVTHTQTGVICDPSPCQTLLTADQGLHYIGWGYIGDLFALQPSGLGFGSTVLFDVDMVGGYPAATSPTWVDGRSAPGSFSGQIAVGISGNGLHFGIDASVTMYEGTFTMTTPGGTGNPFASDIVGPIQGKNILLEQPVLVDGPGCTGGTNFCNGTIELYNVFLNRLGMTYSLDQGNSDSYVPEVTGTIQGAAVFAGGAPAALPVIGAFVDSATTSSAMHRGHATGTLEQVGGAANDLAVKTINIGYNYRTRDTGTQIADRGSVAGVIGWERWTNGTVTTGVSSSLTLSSNQGVHLIHGTPATNIPTDITATYSLVGATSPTIKDGSHAPGTLGAESKVGVNFSQTYPKFGVDLNVNIAGGNYNIQSTGGADAPSLSATNLHTTGKFNATGITTTAGGTNVVCPSGCSADVSGFLSGKGASHLGIIYQFGNAGTDPNKLVSGAAAFAK